MDNWLLFELLARERCAERQREAERERMLHPGHPQRRSPVRRTLASALVRLGLALDPQAHERLPALAIRKAASKAGV